MAAQIIRCTINGELRDFQLTPRDLLRFRDHFGKLASVKDLEPEHGLYLIWLAAKRTGLTDLDFDPFIDTIEDLPEEVERPPLASGNGASSASPSSPDSTPSA